MICRGSLMPRRSRRGVPTVDQEEGPALAVDLGWPPLLSLGGGQGKAQRKPRPLQGVDQLWGALGSGPSSAFMLGSSPRAQFSHL